MSKTNISFPTASNENGVYIFLNNITLSQRIHNIFRLVHASMCACLWALLSLCQLVSGNFKHFNSWKRLRKIRIKTVHCKQAVEQDRKQNFKKFQENAAFKHL